MTATNPEKLVTVRRLERFKSKLDQEGSTAYHKPSGGIPSSDMTQAVQTSLGKADNAAPQATTYTKTEVDSKIAECERKYMLSVAGRMLVFAASPAVVVSGTKLVLG